MSVDAISRQIQTKFDLIRQVIEELPGASDNIEARLPGKAAERRSNSAGDAQSLMMELVAIETSYTLLTAHVFLRMARNKNGGTAPHKADGLAEYQRILAMEDFVGRIESLARRVERVLRVAAPSEVAGCRSIAGGANATARRPGGAEGAWQLLEKVCADPLPAPKPETVEYNQCAECSTDMGVDGSRSELQCPLCGAIRELAGTVFDDAQFYNQEGQKAKSGIFNPNRHYHFWMTRILALEPEEELGDREDPDNHYGEKLLALLRSIVMRDSKLIQLLTVDDARQMLQEIGRTDLNKNVPLILKKLTGVGPPAIPDAFLQRTEKIFSKAIELGEQTRRAGRINRNYYPFYIYKILDAILPPKDYKLRRVLFYIYLQSEDTLAKDDQDWEKICEGLPDDIEPVPTDRLMALKYRDP